VAEPRKTRPVSWIKAALKDFESFPGAAQACFLAALTIAAEGGEADPAKPLHGLGSGVFEIALAFRSDVFASFTRSRLPMISGSSTHFAKPQIDLVRDRMKRLKEALR